MDDQGNRIAESRHYPYGGERWRWPAGGAFPTEYRFTGQRLDGLGLYQMGVRWYSAVDSGSGSGMAPSAPPAARLTEVSKLCYNLRWSGQAKNTKGKDDHVHGCAGAY
jgi:hypothetical protein